jgi:hypothetical protein
MKKLFILLVSIITFTNLSIAQVNTTSGQGWNIYNDVGTFVGISKAVTTTAVTCKLVTSMWHGPLNSTTGVTGANFANTTLRFRKTFTNTLCSDFSYCLETNLADVKVYINGNLAPLKGIYSLPFGNITLEIKSTKPNLNWPSTLQPFISFSGNSDNCSILQNGKVAKNNDNNDAVYPTIADYRIFVNNSYNENTEISIFSITGQVMYTSAIEKKGQLEINTSDFSNGLYIVKLKSVSGEEMTKKVVISH